MTDFAVLVRNASERPSMYLPERTFAAYAAYLDGFNAARDGAPLSGFREWLITRANTGNNLSWPALVQLIGAAGRACDQAADPELPIRDAAALVLEFLAYREEHGLRGVFGEYEAWLRKQEWYDDERHGFRSPGARRPKT